MSFNRINRDLMGKNARQFQKDFYRIATPDFILRQPDGKEQNREEILKATLDRMPDILSVSQMRTNVERLSVKGGRATALITFSARYTLKDIKKGALARATWGRANDLWMRTPQGWKRKRGDILMVKEWPVKLAGRPKLHPLSPQRMNVTARN